MNLEIVLAKTTQLIKVYENVPQAPSEGDVLVVEKGEYLVQFCVWDYEKETTVTVVVVPQ